MCYFMPDSYNQQNPFCGPSEKYEKVGNGSNYDKLEVEFVQWGETSHSVLQMVTYKEVLWVPGCVYMVIRFRGERNLNFKCFSWMRQYLHSHKGSSVGSFRDKKTHQHLEEI